MAPNSNRATRPNGEQLKRKRPDILIAVLLVCAAVFIARQVMGWKSPPRDELHGNVEDAPIAMDIALGKMPANYRLPFLLRSVQDESPGLRYAAVDALGKYDSNASIAAIENAFQDSSSVVRQRAVETLHVVNHERGEALLLSALRDEDSWIREAAITQLNRHPDHVAQRARPAASSRSGIERHGESGALVADRRAVPMLIRALDDDDDVITRQSVALLSHLTDHHAIYKTVQGEQGKRRVLADWKSWWTSHSSQYPAPPALVDARPIRPMRADPAPDFALKDTSGHWLRLAANRGRVTLLNFWGTWCPPCRLELRGLERLHRSYAPRGLDVIGLAVAEKDGAVGLQNWCAQHNVTYRQFLATNEVQEMFGDIHEVPVSVLIDKQSRIRYRWEGERDYGTFQAAVERLLAE